MIQINFSFLNLIKINQIIIIKNNFHYIIALRYILIIIQMMDYNKDNIAKDKAQTWKTFNKLTSMQLYS